jgi:hypothetical protein
MRAEERSSPVDPAISPSTSPATAVKRGVDATAREVGQQKRRRSEGPRTGATEAQRWSAQRRQRGRVSSGQQKVHRGAL